MTSPAPWWALLSSAAAPALLIGGWTAAAHLQPYAFDSTVQTISALAARTATDRWLMTTALICVGLCHVVTSLGLPAAARPGRLVLALGGVATVLVAAFPLPPAGPAPAHAASATVAFTALALWPALSWHRHADVPITLRPAMACAAAAVLLGLVAWFAVSLTTGDHGGLTERLAAAAQACWPLLVALSTRRAGPPPFHRGGWMGR
ncbi:hypothetical protein ACTI_52220 [Actinoplanes sp. OR16]|uniref:DUF998 domain-containing protein n=1 Tax=Actinoplanes sp. OR16 TaxID=946334 RepID=UPI000F70715F|nr:DUF998 domain-containing protein [Actinoplanes sp. OR16]BBH68537.1 hypothetical protein ACTI_52220 [Actinoplanes sp. OR16]